MKKRRVYPLSAMVATGQSLPAQRRLADMLNESLLKGTPPPKLYRAKNGNTVLRYISQSDMKKLKKGKRIYIRVAGIYCGIMVRDVKELRAIDRRIARLMERRRRIKGCIDEK
jgi:hypothetical protein